MNAKERYTSLVPKKPQDHLKELRSRIAKAPQKPGVYRWISGSGEVLYVGKAKNLRNRLKSYVQKKRDPSIGPWKLALRANIADVDWTVTETELEALILETNLIKDLKPKYNVLMKDDKNYVYVRISIKDPYPTVSMIRRIEDDGAKYFGPFLSAHHIHRTLDMLHEVYGWRACERSLGVMNSKNPASARQPRLPCLNSQIGKCNGLCTGKISQEEYRKRIDAMTRFFKGDRSDVLIKLKEKMQRAVGKKLFEDAVKLRDTLHYIESLEEQQIVADTSGADTDYIGVALLSDKAHVVVLRERGGKIISERSYALGGRADTHGEVLGQFLPQYYIALDDIPDTVVCAESPADQETLEQWLNEKRRTKKRITIHVPERGKKSKLLLMAEKNAEEKVKQQLARWEAETQKVDDALTELKNMLDLPEKPKRIECYDISHLGGTETVGSMVVFIDGKSRNNHYRSFTIRTMKNGVIDDYKALKEILVRRLRHLAEREKEWLKEIPIALEKNKKLYVVVHRELESTYAGHGFQYVRSAPKELRSKLGDDEIAMVFEKRKKPDASLNATPNLLILDGGKGQLNIGIALLKNMKLEIPVISLAKREEEVFAPGNPDPVPFPKDSEGRFLLMRLRDEAHRFANNHREKRLKNALLKNSTTSSLQGRKKRVP